MLALDAPRWATLRHAYGAAADVPAMLRAVVGDPGGEYDDVWEPIWSALCHQGTVYTASYAAVPHLVELGAGLPPARQLDCWVFVGCVARSVDAAPIPDDLQEAYLAAIARCEPLIRATLIDGSFEQGEVVHLLAALAAVRGHGGVANALEGLVEGLTPTCLGCAVELTVEWDDRQSVVTVDEPASRRARRELAGGAARSGAGARRSVAARLGARAGHRPPAGAGRRGRPARPGRAADRLGGHRDVPRLRPPLRAAADAGRAGRLDQPIRAR